MCCKKRELYEASLYLLHSRRVKFEWRHYDSLNVFSGRKDYVTDETYSCDGGAGLYIYIYIHSFYKYSVG